MKLVKDEIFNIIKEIISTKTLVKGVFSNNEKDFIIKKIILKPVSIKGDYQIQFEKFENNKAFHENLDSGKALNFIFDLLDKFKQFLFITTDSEIQILKNKKGFSIKKKETSKKTISLSHNNEKNYILKENTPIPFLIKLGVMDKDGNITKEKFNKFRQINRYLEFIEDTLKELQEKKLINDTMKIVDFGCGKSYLTFALYHYLKNIKKMNISITGLDLKDDVITHCNQIAKELNFNDLHFSKGDIKDFKSSDEIDMIFSLHACNIATDYSILKGLELNAKAILAVPCCQSEINQKINQNNKSSFKKELSPLANHGILQERFSSLATDALRALALEACGFNTKVMEFIDMEHTPKNILIKAIRTNSSLEKLQEKKKEIDRYTEFLGVKPLLCDLLKKYFK